MFFVELELLEDYQIVVNFFMIEILTQFYDFKNCLWLLLNWKDYLMMYCPYK